jgi:hypothetical protein
MQKQILTSGLALMLMSAGTLNAQGLSSEVAELRHMFEAMKSDYEARITDLESRLDHAERSARSAGRSADEALEVAEQTAIDLTSGASAPNTFNPAIGLVLVASYADIDAGWEAVPGFIPGGELGPGSPGLSLGESEMNLNANIDSRFYGNLTLALEDEDGETEMGLEEAWIQTTGLSNGLTLRGGRYFSGIGYLNAFHLHADDFADRPLPYQAFLGGQYGPDGVQLRWIAPSKLFLEFGAELDWGSSFPSTGGSGSSNDAWAAFAKVGGDVGVSHSWQVGISYLSADVIDRDLIGLDFVWKWAPDGNSTVRNFKIQGEYFARDETGTFASLPYDGDQDGWYLQGIWQFRQGWRVGYRHDEVDAANGPLFAGTMLEDPGRGSSRDSLMLDWSPSEFSRLRLQFVEDRVLPVSDSQFLLQYLMSLGAHGGHQF